jgi:hypothetical protein
MNLRVRSVTCWSDMVMVVDCVDSNPQGSVAGIEKLFRLFVVAALEQRDFVALKCGSGLTNAVLPSTNGDLRAKSD